MSTLTIADIASDLRLSPRTVQRYCKEGFLPARLSINQSQLSYEIDSSDYLNWQSKHFKGLKKGEASKYTRTTNSYVFYIRLEPN